MLMTSAVKSLLRPPHMQHRPPALTAVLLGVLACQWPGGAAATEPKDKASSAACHRETYRVVLDVGHTAEAFGATSARGGREYDFNLRLAKLIDQKLHASGFAKTVLLVTKGKSRKGLGERASRANALGADVFLSIHHDSVPDSFLQKWTFEGKERGYSDRFKGHSIFVSHDNASYGSSLQFARALGMQLKTRGLRYTLHYTEKFMGHRQRTLVDAEAGVYRYDQLIVLRKTKMAAALLEAGSIINRDEELVLESPERRDVISAAVVDAVDDFCAARSPRPVERIARQPSTKLVQPASMLPTSQTKQR